MMLALLLSLLPALAQDSFDAHGFYPAPDDADLLDHLTVWRPEAQIPGSIAVAALFEYAENPLKLVPVDPNSGNTELVLDDLIGINLMVHAGVHDAVAVAFSLPIWFASTGVDGSQGAALGDVRIHAPVTLVALDPDKERSGGFSLIPFADIPLGANDKFLGNQGWGAGLLVGGSFMSGSLIATANAGIQVTPQVDYANLHGGDKALLMFAVGYEITDWLAAHLETNLRAALVSNDEAWTESPAEIMLSARGRHDKGLSWQAGGSYALTRGASAATYRILAGVGWRYGRDGGDVLFAGDPDGDGIKGTADACPEERESVNNYLDDDGCPDTLATVRFLVYGPQGDPLPGANILVDDEEVGVTDMSGMVELPRLEPGQTLQYEVQNRAAGLQHTILGDVETIEGVTEEVIEVEWMPGAVKVTVRSFDGALLDATITFSGGAETYDRRIDTSGERVFVLPSGDWTLVASHEFFGTDREDVRISAGQTSLVELEFRLEKPIVQVTSSELVILERIHFAFDSAKVKEDSMSILQQVGNALVQHPELELIEIQGHTDSEGGTSYNRGLSQRRMDSVVELLVGQGVNPERLLPVGYGEDCPLADNATEVGREENRRVQFFIVKPDPGTPIPCR